MIRHSFRMKYINCRIRTCAVLSILGLWVASHTVYANTNSAIQSGTAAISNPVPAISRDSSTWSENSGSYVYFGVYPQNSDGGELPVKWKVLDRNNNGAMFLYSDKVLDWKAFNADTTRGNSWEGSEIRQWLNSDFLNRAFPGYYEKNAIIETYKDAGQETGTMEAPGLQGERVFLISWEEADASKYGYFSDNSMLYSNKTKHIGVSDYADAIQPFAPDSWEYLHYYTRDSVMTWTRSPSAAGVTTIGGGEHGGWFGRETEVDKLLGVAPCINLDLSEIAFTTEGSFVKGNELSIIAAQADSRTYNLTLFGEDGFDMDISMSDYLAPGDTVHGSIKTMPVSDIMRPYTQISAMIIDETGSVRAYGKVADAAAMGSVEIGLPSDIPGGQYVLRLFAEQVNSGSMAHAVDFASNYVDFELNIIGPKMELPSSLKEIEEEAFSNSSIEEVLVPANVETIGARAFADCSRLHKIEFAAASAVISPDAFENSGSVTIVAPSGGSIEEYALENNICFAAK